MVYFEKNKRNEPKALGYLIFLSKYENMKLIAFLADVLQIFKRYQQSLQSDNLSIVSLAKNIDELKTLLIALQQRDTNGGWAQKFQESLEEKDGEIFLKNIQIKTPTGTRLKNQKDFHQIRRDVLTTLLDCIQSRFDSDEQFYNIIKPFIEFREEADIQQIHSIFGADLPLSTLSLEYIEALKLNAHDKNLSKQLKTLINSENPSQFEHMITILSRIKACTPQSADVERLIKSNNLLKTASRSNLILKTENKYMYVYYNMPTLEKWNPKKAINIWLNDKDRREHVDIIQKDSARKQPYYKGTFELASSLNDDDEDEVTVTEQNEKNVQF